MILRPGEGPAGWAFGGGERSSVLSPKSPVSALRDERVEQIVRPRNLDVVNSMLRADLHDPGQVGGAGLGEFLCAAREENLEAGRHHGREHVRRHVTHVLERVYRHLWRENGRTHRHLLPRPVDQERHTPLLHEKNLVLALVVMRRRAGTVRRDDARGDRAAPGGLFPGEVKDHLGAEGAHRFTAA